MCLCLERGRGQGAPKGTCCRQLTDLRMVSVPPAAQEGGAAGSSAKPAQEDAASAPGPLLDTWVLPEHTGRSYAALDGDISPMHLHKATAMLMGED
jgi:hypothetical protein